MVDKICAALGVIGAELALRKGVVDLRKTEDRDVGVEEQTYLVKVWTRRVLDHSDSGVLFACLHAAFRAAFALACDLIHEIEHLIPVFLPSENLAVRIVRVYEFTEEEHSLILAVAEVAVHPLSHVLVVEFRERAAELEGVRVALTVEGRLETPAVVGAA